MHPRGSVRRILPYVRLVLKYIASEIEKCTTYDCAVEMRDHMKATRMDAQASDQRTGTGGWYPEVDVNGKWFAFEVTKKKKRFPVDIPAG